jgi:hypothetical protein
MSDVYTLSELTPSDNTFHASKPSDKEGDPIHDTMRHMRPPEKICRRMHCRIVFKEYAAPIYKVKKMGEPLRQQRPRPEVFAVLADLMECQ